MAHAEGYGSTQSIAPMTQREGQQHALAHRRRWCCRRCRSARGCCCSRAARCRWEKGSAQGSDQRAMGALHAAAASHGRRRHAPFIQAGSTASLPRPAIFSKYSFAEARLCCLPAKHF